MQTIIELDANNARKYLLQSSSYCTISLPSYFDFSKVLSFVKQKIGKRDLSSCLADTKKMPSSYDGVNYQLLVNKDGHYAYRRLQLANPYLYYLLVRTITEKANWTEIQAHFIKCKQPTINVVSLPKVKKSIKQVQAGVDIPAWWEDFEQESIALALNYQYVFITDITDCYGSIYTHTIPWSLYGKDYSKEHRTEKNLGNTIDHYMGAMNYDQTNGIPQGSVLFDLIAEIVLAYADTCLYNKLKNKGIQDTDYKILRYRDDYRIFANSKDKIEIIIKVLQEILIDLNFRINTSKTYLSEDVVLNSIKADKRAYLSTSPIYVDGKTTFSTIQKELIYILTFAKEHPNTGMVVRLLSMLLNRLNTTKKSMNDNIRVIISIIVEIMMTSPRVFNVGTALISFFVSKLDTEKEDVIKAIYSKLCRMTNTGEHELWLQRITCHLADVEIDYSEPLTRIVQGESAILWNNDWLKNDLLEGFPLLSICDTKIRDSQKPVISAKEVEIFDY